VSYLPEKKIMADPELSDSQRELGERVLAALPAVGMPVASHQWKYISSLEQWQLHVYTPWMSEKGETTTRRAFTDAVNCAGITESTAFVVLQSPNSKATKKT
jgi:hypothetical protein